MSKRKDRTGKRGKERFMALPHKILACNSYVSLSVHAKVLLVELFYQFNGSNNGDLSATWKQVQKRGWRSRNTLHKCLKELLESGFIVKTRQGGKNKPCLYGVTWLGIDECKGKLDIKENPMPSNLWKDHI